MELTSLDVRTILGLLESGEASSVELTRAYLAAIERLDPRLNAFLAVTPERALERAAAADVAWREGEAGPLCGVPVSLKDMLLTRGVPTTAGSRILAGWAPPYDATAVARLEAAGAVVLGKTNQDEFGMGSSSENSAYGPVRHPTLPGRVPGGSSGGAAAAVAAGLSAAALGTDTGGSVRQPAAFTGLVGVKPTYGRVSRHGVVAYGSSLDQVGPIARTAWDAARLLEVIAGHDPADSTCWPAPPGAYCAAVEAPEGARGLTLGVPREFFVAGMEPAVEESVRAAVARLEEAGARVRPIRLPHTEYAVAAYYLIATAEASSNLARYDGVRFGPRGGDGETLLELYQRSRAEGFGAEVKRRILLGTFVLSAGYYEAYYLKAQKVRSLIRRDFELAFEEVDAILAPTAPTTAFRMGEKTGDPLTMYLADIFTVSPSLAGVPALSTPCGADAEGAPVGLQMIAPWFEEERLLRLAGAWERVRDGGAP
ncbi:MAG: Asp-tRNA(Asn)/Glu-tRNA(Gln) amidotransferase subunit GatA [Thermoanaerobaculia bacterium]|nr:Asp-tRNA(Asn)/Glu-tRNA(Gln) amidotransferase subunit GatA [Thermoanaerobaculia bacterium]